MVGQLLRTVNASQFPDTSHTIPSKRNPGPGLLQQPSLEAREFLRMRIDCSICRMKSAVRIAMKSLALKTSAFLEHFLIQALLYLVLLPLKFIYRTPQPTWSAWFANQKLCQIDGRYC